ncbi:MAG: hypothetical protein HYX24_03730 [Candidatus Aenigmarchaeota archaeon]|nr:hypothetical protein [Candidatus Aenigmarchaeota archaeon]
MKKTYQSEVDKLIGDCDARMMDQENIEQVLKRFSEFEVLFASGKNVERRAMRAWESIKARHDIYPSYRRAIWEPFKHDLKTEFATDYSERGAIYAVLYTGISVPFVLLVHYLPRALTEIVYSPKLGGYTSKLRAVLYNEAEIEKRARALLRDI